MNYVVEFQVSGQYLNLPVKNDARMCLVSLHADGKKVREFENELAEDEPGFWVFSDISEFMGKRLGLYCGGGPNVNRCYKKAN